jgi:hypothetical protein
LAQTCSYKNINIFWRAYTEIIVDGNVFVGGDRGGSGAFAVIVAVSVGFGGGFVIVAEAVVVRDCSIFVFVVNVVGGTDYVADHGVHFASVTIAVAIVVVITADFHVAAFVVGGGFSAIAGVNCGVVVCVVFVELRFIFLTSRIVFELGSKKNSLSLSDTGRKNIF